MQTTKSFIVAATALSAVLLGAGSAMADSQAGTTSAPSHALQVTAEANDNTSDKTNDMGWQ